MTAASPSKMNETAHTPGPWRVGHRAIDVGCENDKLGGYAKLFDVRGWGYLTGKGHGGLGLDPDTAYEIQKANAALAAAAPDMLAALKRIAEEEIAPGLYAVRMPHELRLQARAAISKATAPTA